MKKLIQGIIDFKKTLTLEKRRLFKKLAVEQKPDALFIACSDSRVVPNLFASTDPGDLFVIRNVGNIVPYENSADICTKAAIEFALENLPIADIIICGHSECGAIEELVRKKRKYKFLNTWLSYDNKATDKYKDKIRFKKRLSLENKVSQMHVLAQLDNLSKYAIIRDKMKKKKLRIHGWWFDIAHADVYCYEKKLKEFTLIDEKEAANILKRLH